MHRRPDVGNKSDADPQLSRRDSSVLKLDPTRHVVLALVGVHDLGEDVAGGLG